MADNKTAPTDSDVQRFIEGIENDAQKRDAQALQKLMAEITGESPRMWGSSIVGFGNYHYRYDSGREGDWFLTGFSPRKQATTLYIMSGFKKHDELLSRLGKYKIGKSCLYIKRLDDVDQTVLRELIQASVESVQERYGS